jgi:dTDP-4-dehydrorhamnose reductase
MKPRLLLTGAQGSLGQDFTAFLEKEKPDSFILLACSRQDLDLAASPELLRQHLDDLAPDLIVNAGAFTQVDAAESNHQAADAANAIGPGILADWVSQKPDRYLIHISTDYVFDGKQTEGQAYQPADATAPINYYGLSKLKGEEAVLQAAPSQALVLRTSWLFGSQPRGFVSFVKKALEAGQAANIADDQTGTPTWTGSLCDMLALALIERPTGILHGCNAGKTTRYEQALWIAHCLNLPTNQLKTVSTAALHLPAKRPLNTAMVSSFPSALDWHDATKAAMISY